MRRKFTTEQKMDVLYDTIYLLLFIILIMALKLANVKIPTYLILISILATSFLPEFIRRKRKYKKIISLMEKLNISLEDLQEETGASKYDLSSWKKGLFNTTDADIYQVEDYLQKKYFLLNGKEFGIEK